MTYAKVRRNLDRDVKKLYRTTGLYFRTCYLRRTGRIYQKVSCMCPYVTMNVYI
jgi:hypothetical protein